MERHPSLSTTSQKQGSDSEREMTSEILSQEKTDEVSKMLPIPANNTNTSDLEITSEPSRTSGKCTFIRQQRYLSLGRYPFNCTNLQFGNIAACGNKFCKNVL